MPCIIFVPVLVSYLTAVHLSSSILEPITYFCLLCLLNKVSRINEKKVKNRFRISNLFIFRKSKNCEYTDGYTLNRGRIQFTMSGSNRPSLDPKDKGYYSDILNKNYRHNVERGPDVLQNLQVKNP
jgi:hypothetical protein